MGLTSRFVTALLAGLLLVASPREGEAAGRAASPFPPAKDKWIQVQTAHFTLFSNAPQKRAVEVVRNLEEFRAALAVFHSGFRVDPPRPSFVYVFKTDESYTPYKIRIEGKALEISAGLFIASPDANYITMAAAWREDPRPTIFHEFTHEFLSNNLASVPQWFNEGVAEFYSTFESDEQHARIGRPVVGHVQFLSMNGLLPLSELFGQNYGHDLFAEPFRVNTFYAQSWALVHFLLSSSTERRAQTGKFLDAVSEGIPMERAFGSAFHTTYAAMAQDLDGYVARGRFGFSTLALSEKFKADSSAQVTPISRAEALARLGHLLAHLQEERLADAEAHFQEALRLEPEQARALHGMGRVRSEQGRFEEAVPFLSRASSKLTGDPVLYFDYAMGLLRRNSRTSDGPYGASAGADDRARAKSLLQQALKAMPTFGEAYVELGLLAAGEEDSVAEGTAALEKARQLMPSRADVAANLLVLYLRAGLRQKAQALYDRAVRPSGKREMVEWADNALAAYDRFAAGQAAEAGVSSLGTADDPRIVPGGKSPQSYAEVLEKLLETTTDPEARSRIERQLEAARANADLPGQIESFNRAVDLANSQKLTEALEILEGLLPVVKDPELLANVREMYTDLLRRTGKGAKPGGPAPPPHQEP